MTALTFVVGQRADVSVAGMSMQRRPNGSDEGGKGAGLGDPGGPGTCGSAFGTCVLVRLSLLLAACWVALLCSQGGVAAVLLVQRAGR